MPPAAVYEVVVRKEAERRALQKVEPESAEPSFGDILKQKWEEKQRELEQQARR